MTRPVVAVTLTFLCGVAGGRYWNVPLEGPMIVLFGLALLGYGLQRWHPDHFPRYHTAFLLVLAFLLGVVRMEWEESHSRLLRDEALLNSGGGSFLTGRIADPPREVASPFRDQPALRFLLDDLQLHTGARMRELSTRAQVDCRFLPEPLPQMGDRVRLHASLEPVRAAAWPGQFDYANYLAERDIHATVRLYHAGQLERLGRDARTSARAAAALARFRARLLAAYNNQMPPDHAALLGAMMVGERAELPGDMERLLVETGVFHITAVSGLHITAIVMFLMVAGKLVGLKRRQTPVLAVPLLLLFQCLVGWRYPTLRATTLGIALLGGRWLRRDSNTLVNLALAALFLTLVEPEALFQAGFQLSFLICLGIVLGFARLRDLGLPEKISSMRAVFKWTVLGFAVSLFAFLFGWPVLAWHFSTFTPVSVLVNPFAALFVQVVMVLGIVQSILTFVWFPAAELVAGLNSLCMEALLAVMTFFHDIPGGHISVPRPNLLGLLLYYALLLVLFQESRELPFPEGLRHLTRARLAGGLAALCLMALLLVPSRGELVVDFLSVGQGDCAVVRFPEGGVMMIDGGRSQMTLGRPWEETRFAHWFRAEGIDRIDLLVTTHPQLDHFGAAIDILNHFPVGALVDSGIEVDSGNWTAYAAALEHAGADHLAVDRGDIIEGIDGVEIRVLNPRPVESPFLGETNETSVVLWVRYGDIEFLFTGDIGTETERELVRVSKELDVEILKVCHHGSAYSSCREFLAATTPEVAVICVGPNPYGHPAPETVDRLWQHGALVLRTDLDGSVRVTTDGERYWVEATRHEGTWVGE